MKVLIDNEGIKRTLRNTDKVFPTKKGLSYRLKQNDRESYLAGMAKWINTDYKKGVTVKELCEFVDGVQQYYKSDITQSANKGFLKITSV